MISTRWCDRLVSFLINLTVFLQLESCQITTNRCFYFVACMPIFMNVCYIANPFAIPKFANLAMCSLLIGSLNICYVIFHSYFLNIEVVNFHQQLTLLWILTLTYMITIRSYIVQCFF